MDKADNHYDIASPRQMTCDQLERLAVGFTIGVHLVGCALVLIYLILRGDAEIFVLGGFLLVFTFVVTIILSALLGLVTFRLFHQTTLPLASFVRICCLLLELSLFTWVVLFLTQLESQHF